LLRLDINKTEKTVTCYPVAANWWNRCSSGTTRECIQDFHKICYRQFHKNCWCMPVSIRSRQ